MYYVYSCIIMFECIFCKLQYNELQYNELQYNELINNKCVFCNIIHYNNKNNIYNIVIGYTKCTQLDIIKNTYNLFMTHDCIPLPNEIDSDVILIKINPYIFRQFIKYLKNDSKNSKLIDNFKIFFTNTIDLNKIKSKRFSFKYKSKRLNIDFLSEQKELSEIDTNIENLYKNFLRDIIYNEREH